MVELEVGGGKGDEGGGEGGGANGATLGRGGVAAATMGGRVSLVRKGLLELVLREGTDREVPGRDVVRGGGVDVGLRAADTEAGAGGVAAGGAGLGAETAGAAAEGGGVDGAVPEEATGLAVEGEDRAGSTAYLAR